VHNYGHGGSGWSLSWGSAAAALDLALAGRDPSRIQLAVIGCGALGLTAAIAAQRAGARVTIYAKERPPHVRSSVATGSWTPDSRCALTRELTSAFAAQWEQMTRLSWRTYTGMLSAPNAPIQFHDRYTLSDLPPEEALDKLHTDDPIGFAYLLPRVPDLAPPPEDLGPGQHPFPHRWARRNSQMIFNITAYSEQLLADFEATGGKLVTREFHTPADLALLPERVIIHATGYGARSLFGDTSITPVRGQIAWLPAQPEIDYALQFDNLNIVARGDGIVVQSSEQGEATGFDNDSEVPNEGEAQRGVAQLASLYDRMAAGSVIA
jgi:glycine/D-amino acid oxidase-like deaminating enzyme